MRNIRFLFTSSVGSAQGWDNNNGPFPEEIQLDPSDAIGAGYGESKYATERVSETMMKSILSSY
jgi:nucleoside-diphosphate-sugar epimerase